MTQAADSSEITDVIPEATDATQTRPSVAPRQARHAAGTRRVTRYTLDLEAEQHKFLRMYAVSHDVEASKVMRTLLFLLEADQSLSKRVLQEIFPD